MLEDFSPNGLKVYNQIIVSKDFRQEAFDHNKDGFIDEKTISRKVGKDRITVHYKHYLWGDTFLVLNMKRRHSKGIQEAHYRYDFQTKNYQLVSFEDRPFRSYSSTPHKSSEGKNCSPNAMSEKAEAFWWNIQKIEDKALIDNIKKTVLSDSCKEGWEEESDTEKSGDIIAKQIANGMKKFDKRSNCLSKNGSSFMAMKLQARFWEMLQEGNEYKVSCREELSSYSIYSTAPQFLNASYSEENKEICFHKKLPSDDPNFYENKFIHEALHSIGEKDETYVQAVESCCATDRIIIYGDGKEEGFDNSCSGLKSNEYRFMSGLKSSEQRLMKERLGSLLIRDINKIQSYEKIPAYGRMLEKFLAKYEEQCARKEGSILESGCKMEDYRKLKSTIIGKDFLVSIDGCDKNMKAFCERQQKKIVNLLNFCKYNKSNLKDCQESFYFVKKGVWLGGEDRSQIIAKAYAEGDGNNPEGEIGGELRNVIPLRHPGQTMESPNPIRGGGPPVRGYAAKRARIREAGPPVRGYAAKQARIREAGPPVRGYAAKRARIREAGPPVRGYAAKQARIREAGPPVRGYAAKRARKNREESSTSSVGKISPIGRITGKTSGVDYTDEIRSRRSRSYNNVKTKQVSRAVRTSRVGQAYQAQRVELENIVDRTNPVIKKVVNVFNSTLKTVSNYIVPKAHAQVVAQTVGSGTGGGGGG